MRASESYHAAARARTKTPALSDGAKTAIREIYLKLNHGYDPIVKTKEMKKGDIMEEAGIELYSKYFHEGAPLFKNQTRVQKGYLSGTPDLVLPNLIPDIKNCYNPQTFINADLKRQYEWQLRAYMHLYDVDNAELVYVLLDLPEWLYEDELRKFCWQMDILDPEAKEYELILEKHRDQFIYSGNNLYPEDKRIKRYQIKRDEEKEQKLLDGLDMAAEYYAELSLNFCP